ncbi:hypothetical protein TNIN_52351 [Trichonephila inaurata madagascariensis]|uniref:Uncharacterized protein n=1 Tax=Trichonephila inaurata madagascariensis TaxID=2747483 RepID=A0A8X6IB51_9ARAC|nr:hypothetical protein TNIN_52351 [Trichonephila inaurata madagascariensis]
MEKSSPSQLLKIKDFYLEVLCNIKALSNNNINLPIDILPSLLFDKFVNAKHSNKLRWVNLISHQFQLGFLDIRVGKNQGFGIRRVGIGNLYF